LLASLKHLAASFWHKTVNGFYTKNLKYSYVALLRTAFFDSFLLKNILAILFQTCQQLVLALIVSKEQGTVSETRKGTMSLLVRPVIINFPLAISSNKSEVNLAKRLKPEYVRLLTNILAESAWISFAGLSA